MLELGTFSCVRIQTLTRSVSCSIVCEIPLTILNVILSSLKLLPRPVNTHTSQNNTAYLSHVLAKEGRSQKNNISRHLWTPNQTQLLKPTLHFIEIK